MINREVGPGHLEIGEPDQFHIGASGQGVNGRATRFDLHR
jgi:hypothetical protein